MSKERDNRRLVGWREWVVLPELKIPGIRAKIDSGARTSALHTFDLKCFRRDGKRTVRFGIHPIRQMPEIEIYCEADVIDRRPVTDSGGHCELRYVIRTPIRIGEFEWPVEITLTNRENMRFRMLLGRTALRGRFLVNPDISYCFGRNLRAAYPRRKRRKT